MRQETLSNMSESTSGKPRLSQTDLLVVLDGDSLTHGQKGVSLNQPVAYYLQELIRPLCKSLEIYSFGVGGQTTEMMISDAATQIDPRIRPEKTNVYFHWEDVNAMLNYGGVTAQQNYDDHETLGSGRKTAGFDYTIHVVGYYPRLPVNDPSWTSLLPNQKDYMDMSVNTPIPSADVVLDLRNNTIVGGAEGQAIDSNYFNDSVHLFNDGYKEVAINSAASYYTALREIFDL